MKHLELGLLVEHLVDKHNFSILDAEQALGKGTGSSIWKALYPEVLQLDPCYIGQLVLVGRGFRDSADRTALYSIHNAVYLPPFCSGEELLRILATTTLTAEIVDYLYDVQINRLDIFEFDGHKAIIYDVNYTDQHMFALFDEVEIEGKFYRKILLNIFLVEALSRGTVVVNQISGKRICERLPKDFFGLLRESKTAIEY